MQHAIRAAVSQQLESAANGSSPSMDAAEQAPEQAEIAAVAAGAGNQKARSAARMEKAVMDRDGPMIRYLLHFEHASLTEQTAVRGRRVATCTALYASASRWHNSNACTDW